MSDLNGDLEALQDQRAEIAQMQNELEELRAHAAAVNNMGSLVKSTHSIKMMECLKSMI